MSDQSMNRRQFLKRLTFLSLAVPASRFLNSGLSIPTAWAGLPAAPAGQQLVPDTDPVAMAIGYKPDVKDLDYKKFPQRKKPEAKNQFCENCALYTKVDGNWGKCQMLTSGVVYKKGWCGSWNKKA